MCVPEISDDNDGGGLADALSLTGPFPPIGDENNTEGEPEEDDTRPAPTSLVRMPDGKVYRVQTDCVNFAPLYVWWMTGVTFRAAVKVSNFSSKVAGLAIHMHRQMREAADFPRVCGGRRINRQVR